MEFEEKITLDIIVEEGRKLVQYIKLGEKKGIEINEIIKKYEWLQQDYGEIMEGEFLWNRLQLIDMFMMRWIETYEAKKQNISVDFVLKYGIERK